MFVAQVFKLVLLLALAGLVGSLLPWGSNTGSSALAAMVVLLAVMHLKDAWSSSQFIKWLRADDVTKDPLLSGQWSDFSDRIRRILKQKESIRLSSEETLRQFLGAIQASPNGVLLLDEESRIQWCNQTAAKHLGIDPNLDSQQLIGNMLRNPVFSSYVNAKVFDSEIIIEGRLHRADRPHKVGIQLFPYGEGRLLLLSRDVTSIEQAEVMRRDFVANVSHEIRTPLTVLLGFVETMQTLQLTDGDRAHYLDLMSTQAHRMQTLVEDLLTLSRLEGSPYPSHYEWVSVPSLFKQCEQEALGFMNFLQKDGSAPHQLTFEMDVHDEACEIAGSSKELISAFSNLITNALRYTPAGGQIAVRWTSTPDAAVFSVEDNGPGISSEHLPRLSERFYRIDRSRSRETGGTGLGLAIVKHVIHRHGGKLQIESKLHQGSKFSLAFPSSRVRRHQTLALADSNV